MPPVVLDAMKATESALEGNDAEAACEAITSVGNALYEWQDYARGNQPVLIEELLRELESLSSTCSYRQQNDGGEIDSGEIDGDELGERYEAWASFAHKNTKRQSGLSTWALYIFGPLLAGGFLMFWRRKFREA